jgi:DNA processing protein
MLGVGSRVADDDGANETSMAAFDPGIDDPADPERDAWAVLAGVDGLGPVGFATLLRAFGSGEAILRIATEPGGPERLAAATAEPDPSDPDRRARVLDTDVTSAIADAAVDAPRAIARIRELGLQVITVDDPAYPSRLAAIQFPPHLLFVLGDPGAMATEHAIAVVGTRRATTLGRGLASRIAAALAEAGATVVSGLAVGIDGAAHAATLAAGGRTVAVIGGGHARLYPRAHDRLAGAIVAGGGAVVSEIAPDIPPAAWSFPRRNRIISGLSDATVVVEAPARSGALVTASWAIEQGRGCFLVPGPIDDPATEGSLAFLREVGGEARIVTGVPQLLEDLELAQRAPRRRVTALADATLTELGGTAARVGEAVLDGHVTVDAMVAATGLTVAIVLATLTLLERRGLAVGVYGRYRPAGSLAASTPRRRPRPRSATAG